MGIEEESTNNFMIKLLTSINFKFKKIILYLTNIENFFELFI